MRLRQPGSTYSTYGSSTKNKERIQIFKGTGDSRDIYQNKLEKACFQHCMAYGNFKDLLRRAASDIYVINNLILLKFQNMMDIKEELLQWFINVLTKHFLLGMPNQTI